MMSSNFIVDVLNGEALLDDIDSYVAFWHENNFQNTLQDFLGFTDDEYDVWMKEGNHVVRDVLYCRRNNLSFADYLKSRKATDETYPPDVLKKYIATA